MTKILIIEDEIRLADVLYDWFYNKNFQVTAMMEYPDMRQH